MNKKFNFKKLDEIELDLKENILEGFDSNYDILNVEVLRIARDIGHIFPRVDIVFEEGVYRLLFGRDGENFDNYGGHSRAISALIKGSKLECSLFNIHKKDPREFIADKEMIYKPISKIKGLRKVGHKYMTRLKNNLSYLPSEIANNFISNNNLVLTESGILMDLEDYKNPPPF